jgi:FkbM family methyltransferase
MKFSRIVRKLAARAGFLIEYRTPQTDPVLRLVRMLASHGVNHVADIGANRGQFGEELLANGFSGRITSFEPLPTIHKILKQRAQRHANWAVHDIVALSNHNGDIALNESSNDVCSSIYHFDEQYSDGMTMVSTHIVPSARLDDLALEGRLFLKIDTQGSEMAILNGGRDTLLRAIGVQVEMSVVPVYGGLTLQPEISEHLEAAGFALWDIVPAHRDRSSHRLLQYDGVYFRMNSVFHT